MARATLAKGRVKRNPGKPHRGGEDAAPVPEKTYAALSIGQVAVWTIQVCNGLTRVSFRLK